MATYKTCIFCKFFWTGKNGDRKQYYCQWKLQEEREKSDVKQENAYVKCGNAACDMYERKDY